MTLPIPNRAEIADVIKAAAEELLEDMGNKGGIYISTERSLKSQGLSEAGINQVISDVEKRYDVRIPKTDLWIFNCSPEETAQYLQSYFTKMRRI